MDWKFIPGLFATLFPAEWRRRLFSWLAPTSAQAALSGVMELLLCLSWLAWSYFHLVPSAISGYIGAISAQSGETKMVEHAGGVAVAYGMGFTALFAFLLRWQTLVGCYFAFEGTVRAVGAIAAGDYVPTLPLIMLHGACSAAQHGWRRLQLPPLVADTVTREGEELCIASCRPQPEWHPLAVISYQDRLYELAGTATGDKARPWIYRLRPAPASKVVRGYRVYDPEELLGPKART